MSASINSDDFLLRKIGKFALLSRVILTLFQVVFNFCLPDHDAGVFLPPLLNNKTDSYCDKIFETLLAGFYRWDAVYFLTVAQYGYIFENCLAFFPLYPFSVKLVSYSILYPLQFFLNYTNVILLSSLFLNVFLFVKTAENLFRLGRCVTKNDVIAYKAALLFCFNPASIFMSAPYSETLYAYLSILGMYKMETDCKLTASVLFGLSCATRSNGLLNVGYLAYKIAKILLTQLTILKTGMIVNLSTLFTSVWIFGTLFIFPYSILMLIALLPFALVQYYSYALYCEGKCEVDIPVYLSEYGRSEGLKMCGDPPSSWCNQTVPLAYSFIQKHYWNQGLFNYWELKQIPNFVLAMPVTLIVLGMAFSYYRYNRYTCLTLGLDEVGSVKKDGRQSSMYHLHGVTLLPYVCHALLLTIFGWLFIHIQVLTRLLFSSTPVLYWYTAHLISMDTPQQQPINKLDVIKSSRQQVEMKRNIGHSFKNLLTNQLYLIQNEQLTTKMVFLFFFGYFIVGTLMFSNFLPWT